MLRYKDRLKRAIRLVWRINCSLETSIGSLICFRNTVQNWSCFDNNWPGNRTSPLRGRTCDLSDDARSGRHAHLDHDQPQKDLNGVGADFHSICDFFASQTLEKQLYRLLLALRQAETRTNLGQVRGVIPAPLQQEHERRMIWHLTVAVNVKGKGTAMIGSSCRSEVLVQRVRNGRHTMPQVSADSLGEPALQMGNLLRESGKCEYPDSFEIRCNYT